MSVECDGKRFRDALVSVTHSLMCVWDSVCVFQWMAAGRPGLRGVCVLWRVVLVCSHAIASVRIRSELGTDCPVWDRTERTVCVLQHPAAVSERYTVVNIWSGSKFIKVVLRQECILVVGFRTTLMKGFDPLQMLTTVYTVKPKFIQTPSTFLTLSQFICYSLENGNKICQ